MTRVWQTLMFLLVLALTYVGWAISHSAGATKVLRAQRFELVDDKGKMRGVFGVLRDGDPGVILYDQHRQSRGSFVLWGGDPKLILCDDKGAIRGGFGLNNGLASLVLTDDAGNVRGKFVLQRNGDGGFVLADDKGRARPSSVFPLRGISKGGTQRSFPCAKTGSRPMVDPLDALEARYRGEVQSKPVRAPRLPSRRSNLSGLYAGTGSGHWLNSKTDDGSVITLEDGSTWEVIPTDQVDTALWLPTTDITVIDGDDPAYPYRLINKDDGETADAKLLSD